MWWFINDYLLIIAFDNMIILANIRFIFVFYRSQNGTKVNTFAYLTNHLNYFLSNFEKDRKKFSFMTCISVPKSVYLFELRIHGSMKLRY